MKNKKLITVAALVCCAVLLVGLTISATVAYLTSTSEVNNTFTVGKVKIDLDEAAIKQDGSNWVADDTKPRVKQNAYKLEPACTYSKDPTITVEAGSEEAYIRAFVTVTKINELNTVLASHNEVLSDFFVGRDTAKWDVINLANPTVTNDTCVFEFRYYQTVTATAETKLEPLFTQIAVPTAFTGDDLQTISGMQIHIEAQAIQAAGFADADAAWAVFTK